MSPALVVERPTTSLLPTSEPVPVLKSVPTASSSSSSKMASTTPVTRYRTALFGYPISQSLAPTFHSACYRARNLQSDDGAAPTAEQLAEQRLSTAQHWTCELQETQDFNHFLTWSGRASSSSEPSSSKFGGAAITMPYKSVVLSHVDEIDDEARLIGAANTVYWRAPSQPTEGKDVVLVATNTDVAGVANSMLAALPEGAAAKVTSNLPTPPLSSSSTSSWSSSRIGLIVGGGGTTRTSIFTLRFRLGCGPIYIINRLASEVQTIVDDFASKGVHDVHHLQTPEDVAAAFEEPSRMPEFIVNAIPSYEPQSDEEKLARKTLLRVLALPQREGMPAPEHFPQPTFLEMAYHPTVLTPISLHAEKQGWNVVLGVECMYHQAIAQQHLWLSPPATPEARKQLDETMLAAGRQAAEKILRARGAFNRPETTSV